MEPLHIDEQYTPNILPPINTETNVSDMINEIEISEKEIDIGAHFFVTFIDGSSFKNIIEYLRGFSIIGVFIFRKDKILYQKGNSDNTILNEVEIKTYELTDYEFYSDKEEIIVSVDLIKLKDRIKGVGKKDHVDIYRLEGEPQHLYIKVRSQSEQDGEPFISLIPCETTDLTIYNIPPYTIHKKSPTCTIYQSDFAKFCKSVITIKSKHVTAHGFKNGVIFKGISNLNTLDGVKEFGKCRMNTAPERPKSFFGINADFSSNIVKSKAPPPVLNIREIGEIENFKIPIPIVKQLTKLNGLSPNGTIKVYIEKSRSMKLICNIGTFGKLTVYLP